MLKVCATSNLLVVLAVLALLLSYLSAAFLLGSGFLAWPRCKVGSQSGFVSLYRAAGLPDIKCLEQILLFTKTFRSSRPWIWQQGNHPFASSLIVTLTSVGDDLWNSVERHVFIPARTSNRSQRTPLSLHYSSTSPGE